MKTLLIRLAGGAGLATALAVLGSSGASAASGSEYGHAQQQSNYDQRSNDYASRSYSQNSNNSYDSSSYARQSSDRDDYSSRYATNNNYDSSYGMMYHNTWYNYSQMGYWNYQGCWMPYSQNWSSDDWQMWYQQH